MKYNKWFDSLKFRIDNPDYVKIKEEIWEQVRENLEEVKERGIKFFKQIKQKYENSQDRILIVSHGAFLKAFIGNLLGMNLYYSIFKLFIEHCSLTELEISNQHKEGYRFNFINDVSHLKIS